VKLDRNIVKMLDDFPDTVIERVEKNRHYKLFLITPAGKRILVVSITASDRRAEQNNRSILNRWSKGISN
jgi:hypothetical protein